jgi:V/A-type H+-transporting ATPase subunit I
VAIEKVSRVLVAVHQEGRDIFLKKLQRLGVMHITQTESATAGSQANADSSRVIQAIETLTPRIKKKKGAGGRKQLSRREFDDRAESYDHASTVERLGSLTREQAELEARLRTLETEIRRLVPWSALARSPREMYGMGTVAVSFGRFPGEEEFQAAKDALQQGPAAIEFVGRSEREVYTLVAAVPDSADRVGRTLGEHRFEAVDLRNVNGRPQDVIASLVLDAAKARERLQAVGAEVEELGSDLPELKVKADALSNEEARRATAASLARTESVALMHGWVRTRDKGRLEKLVTESGAAAMTEVQPAAGEDPPVALVNRPVFRPFEMVLELFSMPQPTELDPTWLIAPFFSVFFALCLTDAGYGIVVAVLTYVLMKKMGTNNKLLGIILIGAILTIPAGALVGGWFGDIPDRLGIGWLQAFKNRLMWFDPVKDPMKFFIISIALGYLQMIAGIAFEIADCLRVRNYGDGLLGQLPWFVFINALVARVLLAKLLAVWAAAGLVVLVLASVAAIVVFTQRSRETMLSQSLWFFLILSFFVHFGAKVRWLPPELFVAKWAFVGLFVAMFVYAVWSVAKARSLKPVPVGLAVLGLAGAILYFANVLPPGLAFLPGLLFILLSPASRSMGTKLAWGGYALYGATGYIGVVLSYIRLMALGMCTGGVAVAINVIAWMILPVPIVGVIGAFIVLVVGHTYNIAVNVLGAFVHSLRLQYVEFFPRFYTGGGERFAPFREVNQFVSVK